MISCSLPDLDALDMEALKALVISQHNELLEQRSNAQEIERLKLIIEKYRRMIFGRKSEKLTGQLEQLELRLEELETAQAAEEAVQDAGEASQQSPTQTVARPRRRPVRKPLPEDLPREVITPSSSAQQLSGLRWSVTAVWRRRIRATGADPGEL